MHECGAKRKLSIGILIALLSLIGVCTPVEPLEIGGPGQPPLSPPSRAGAARDMVLEVYLSKAARRRETGSAPTGVVEETASTGQLTWRDEREENE